MLFRNSSCFMFYNWTNVCCVKLNSNAIYNLLFSWLLGYFFMLSNLGIVGVGQVKLNVYVSLNCKNHLCLLIRRETL